MLRIPVEKLHKFMVEVFTRLQVPAEEAKICADVLIESDLRGIESHGIGRCKMYYDRIKAGIQFPETKIDIIRDKYATAVWDGNHGMGHVISHRAMQTAIDKAKKYGIGCVVVRNSTHYGIAGYYASMATQEDMIGITFTNARPSIAPTNGVDPMLGTNPICFGAPSNLEYPFLFDGATSISQRGKIEVLDREGKETPLGWAIDRQGKPFTDTKQLLKDLISKQAAMLPIGGADEETGSHKGYSLGVMVEILCAALQNGAYLHGLHGFDKDGNRIPYKLGHFFLAINIDFFTEIADFKKITGDIMTTLQKSQVAPNKDKIWIAGEKEYYKEKEIRDKGVPITPALLENLKVMQKELGIEMQILD
jgi:LDH2 family malate/lactate/ureidoglycolate dehydrogenase